MHKKAVTLSLLLTAYCAFFLPEVSFASNEGACELAPKIENIRSLVEKNTTPGSREAQMAELVLRREALKAVLDCAKSELDNKKNQVESTSPKEDLLPTKEKIISRINEASDYYDSKRGGIDGMGLRATQETARSIRQWREGTLSPTLKSGENLTLWIKNDEMIASSKLRLEQVAKSFEVLKLGNNEELLKLFVEGRKKYESALDAHNRAGQMLSRLGPPDYTESLIKETLNNLSESYKSLVELGEKTKKDKE